MSVSLLLLLLLLLSLLLLLLSLSLSLSLSLFTLGSGKEKGAAQREGDTGYYFGRYQDRRWDYSSKCANKSNII